MLSLEQRNGMLLLESLLRSRASSNLGGFPMEYVLKNEYLTVKFQTVGGTLSSIKDNDGVEYLWQGDKTYWYPRG